MKRLKGLLSVLLILVLCLTMSGVTAFAAETTDVPEVVSIERSTNSMAYDSAWIPAGTTEGYFPIKKDFSGNASVTFKARSSNTSVKVRMKLCVGENKWNSRSAVAEGSTNEIEFYPSDLNISSEMTYYVYYEFPYGNPEGTFLMCWIYN